MEETKIIYTRFPPEPNGRLHFGHGKSLAVNFLKYPGCRTYLRFDDTNPETEKQSYVDSILEDVKWLKFAPWRITYTSDYFPRLYEFAVELIKADKAYVDFTMAGKMSEMKREGLDSIYRKSSIEKNLAEFEKMKNGHYDDGDAILRLKIGMTEHHNLRDPVAYRIKKKVPHYRTDTKWCIYPTYDYSHGIVDALENITYSYCSAEFYDRRSQYFWPVHELIKLGHNELVPAIVHEFGRLTIDDGILSKRKILELIKAGYVADFDDPRLFTISGMRARGYSAEALRNLLSDDRVVSLDRSETKLDDKLVRFHMRKYLDDVAIRMFAVMHPLPIFLPSMGDEKRTCAHVNHPKKSEMKSHNTILTSKLFIEKSDFRQVDEKDYYGLAPLKTVRLKCSDFIECGHVRDGVIECKWATPLHPKKVKGIIHWVSLEDSVECEFIIYDSKILNDDKSYNDASIKRICGRVECSALSVPEEIPIQFERLGYFKRIKSVKDTPCFTMICDLK